MCSAWISLPKGKAGPEVEPGYFFSRRRHDGSQPSKWRRGGIVAFYAIVNIPERFLASVFREMKRVLQPDGRLFLAFHVGNETLHRDELLGYPDLVGLLPFSTADDPKLSRRTGVCR